MTREEAKDLLRELMCDDEYDEAIDMAIEALQFAKHFDLLKDYQSLQEVVRCKDCTHRHTDDCPIYHEEWYEIDEGGGCFDSDFIVHDDSKDNDFCSRGERKGGDSE